jgi:hypothetical protein
VSRRRAGVGLLLALVLAGAAALYVRGLTVDLPAEEGWRLDETSPRKVMGPRSAWPARYPLLHRDLLRASFHAARAVLPAVFDAGAYRWEFWLVGRGLSVAMALATLVLLWRIACRFAAPGPALLAPLAYALCPPVDFLARTMNLDTPYTFWFAASLLAWLDLLDRRRAVDALGFALCGAAAILTKDQAAALYALPLLYGLVALVREKARCGWGRALPAALADRRVVLPALAALGLAALVYRLPQGFGLVRRHLAATLGEASQPYRLVSPDLGGLIDLAALTARNFANSTGAVTLILAGAGFALALADRRLRRGATVMLFAASYALFFLAPIGYVYDRFLLPPLLVLAVFAPAGLARVADPRLRGWCAALAATLLVAVDGRATLEISQRAAGESRPEVTRLLTTPGFRRQRPLAVGRERLLPRGVEIRHAVPRADPCRVLADRRWLVVHPRWAFPRQRWLVGELEAGRLGYERAATFGGEPFEHLDFSRTPGSNLEKLDLGIDLYRRVVPCPSPAPASGD